MTFADIGLSQQLVTAIDRLGFTEPTLIQEESIPHIMVGEDVIGESATGSGKTLAFGCGVIEACLPGEGIQALILTPTRELAQQVKEQIQELSRKLNVVTIYGGVGYEPQIKALKTAEVVVATPGRLLDHMQQGTIELRDIRILVLDEADRMLDMGFVDDVEKIMKTCPEERQTLFFSATIDDRIKGLSRKHMRNPIKVQATRMVDPTKLEQIYFDVQKHKKLSLLINMLANEGSGLCIVFCNTRRTTDFVEKNLRANKIRSMAIHGGLSQNKRNRTIKDFSDARVDVLVCTDVAARGIHVDNVSHVYNYEIPKDPKDYVHRIGRTARAGEDGKVINLLSDVDHQNFDRIIRSYRDYNIHREEMPHLERVHIVKDERKPRGNRGFNRGNRRGGQGQRRSQSRRGSPRHRR